MSISINDTISGIYTRRDYRFDEIKQNNTNFSKVLLKTNESERLNSDFESLWKSKFPDAKYHVVDASKIPQNVWERNDFPFEQFFNDKVDENILNWTPSGKEPSMSDSGVQTRLNSTLGRKAIVIPPSLEEKMKNNPDLAKSVMNKVEIFINTHPTRPGRICSYLISLDENGDIAHFRVTGGGGISGPSKEELRKFEEEQAEKKKRQEEYIRNLKKSSMKNQDRKKEIELVWNQRKTMEAIIGEYESFTIV